MKEELTAVRLRELLHYDPETGVFTWRVKASRNTTVGSVAGSFTTAGYPHIRMLGKQFFYSHRLAWLYMTGDWPVHEIDHIDGNPANTRWANLRSADRTENMRNTRRPSHNTSGVKGVCWSSYHRKWRAYIVVAKRQRSLGYFDNKKDAAAAYARAAMDLFGEFARVA